MDINLFINSVMSARGWVMVSDDAFVFERPLTEGLIYKRRNRFIMEVEVGGTMYDCHCPVTGRIGNILLSSIPCLLSQSHDRSRKTPYTVEAISLDSVSSRNKHWIGINQNAVNRYVEHFLRTKQFSRMVDDGDSVKREQKLGNSRLDFLVGNTYIEVKMPLIVLQVPVSSHIKTKQVSEFDSSDRFIKHIEGLASSLKQNERAILLNCFIYDNPGFRVTIKSKHSDLIKGEVQSCIKRGIEIWQVNLIITPTEVKLAKLYETTDDFMEGGAAYEI